MRSDGPIPPGEGTDPTVRGLEYDPSASLDAGGDGDDAAQMRMGRHRRGRSWSTTCSQLSTAQHVNVEARVSAPQQDRPMARPFIKRVLLSPRHCFFMGQRGSRSCHVTRGRQQGQHGAECRPESQLSFLPDLGVLSDPVNFFLCREKQGSHVTTRSRVADLALWMARHQMATGSLWGVLAQTEEESRMSSFSPSPQFPRC